MASSYNGWSASPNLRLRPLVVAGEAFAPGIRDDNAVHAVLGYVAQQMHERVEPIVRSDWHQADDWGFSYRSNRNSSNLSNHASGTAIDYNATRHPNGVPTRRTFTRRQIREVHRILAEVDHAVRWGGDYTGTPDAMHFEINTDPVTLRRVAADLNTKEEGFMLTKRIKRWFRKAIRNAVVDAVAEAPLNLKAKDRKDDSGNDRFDGVTVGYALKVLLNESGWEPDKSGE